VYQGVQRNHQFATLTTHHSTVQAYPVIENQEGPAMTYGQTDQELTSAAAMDGYVPQTSLKPDIPSWWAVLERHSRLLVAAVNIQNHRIEWSSDRFRHLVGMVDTPPVLGEAVLQRLEGDEQLWVRERIRRHILNAILTDQYGHDGLLPSRWLHEPLILSVKPLEGDRARFVEFMVSSDQLRLLSVDATVEAALHACWTRPPTPVEVMQQLNDPDAPLQQVLQRLNPDTYEASGTILLEGMDVSDREVTQRLIHLLLDRESILEPRRFHHANQLLKRLFRATDSLILTAEANTAALYLDLDQPEWTTHTLPVASLQESPLFQAAAKGTVLNVRHLAHQCPSECETLMKARGAKSLLVLPLVVKSVRLKASSQLLGLVGLMSDQVDAFDALDEMHGRTLAPALTIAMRQTVNERFTNIHEAVRWRFEEEAERRSLGLPPEAITFRDVYPLYGISDIRGSSHERNRAIQQDLLEQFHLGLAIAEAVYKSVNTAFARQVRDDLHDKIEELHQGVTVDAEITLLRYLQENLEAYFDFFQSCGSEAAQAIAAYEAAKDPHHGGIYKARANYDHTVQTINLTLRHTWQQWQQTMQAVTPHYCDIETTDGIDHMIYAGQAIDPQFSRFHLRSLRYEQLRAVCDCARTGFRLKAAHQTEMEITHLVLVQDSTVDITHDENTERLFDVRGTRDTRYEIVKKRIDKALDAKTHERITQPGCLTVVYSTVEEWKEYEKYLRYLQREGWIGDDIEQGSVEPLQGVTGLKFARVPVLEA
jgi:hypothetical protein